jgi:type VI secretion system protein ImpC
MIPIDLDSFDQVLDRLAPRLLLGGDGTTESADVLEFRAMDDFRPEGIVRKMKNVRQLLELRQNLLSPTMFAHAAAELRQGLLADASVTRQRVETASPPHVTSTEDDAATLERILGQQSPNAIAGTPGSPAPSIQNFINRLVAPYIVPKADPRQGVYLAAVDQAIGDQIRGVLHAPAFQALEATWCSLRNLISSIEDESKVKVHLLDVTYEELLAEVPTNDDGLSQWSLFRRLTNANNSRWSLIMGDFSFGARPEDLALLSALAITAESFQVPFISSAQSSLVGCRSLVSCSDPSDWQPLDTEVDRCWQALRHSSAATWVGLVLPRILLRMPYGKDTDEVDGIAFEEFSPERRHEDYLWGNSAYLCVQLIVQQFVENGWARPLGGQIDIGDLPAHTYIEDGEHKLQPCAEAGFGERTAEALLNQGLMPLLSWADRNMIRFVRFQSIADPLSPLAGTP